MTISNLIPASHFMAVGKRVESSWAPGIFGTVIRDLGDRFVLVAWDNNHVDTACNEDDLEPAPALTAPKPLAIGDRIYVTPLGMFAPLVDITPGHDCRRLRFSLGHGEFFDTSDVALGLTA